MVGNWRWNPGVLYKIYVFGVFNCFDIQLVVTYEGPNCYAEDNPQCSSADLSQMREGVWFKMLRAAGTKTMGNEVRAVEELKKETAVAGIQISNSCLRCQAASTACGFHECGLSQCLFPSSKGCIECGQKRCSLARLCGVDQARINLPEDGEGHPATWVRNIQPEVRCYHLMQAATANSGSGLGPVEKNTEGAALEQSLAAPNTTLSNVTLGLSNTTLSNASFSMGQLAKPVSHEATVIWSGLQGMFHSHRTNSTNEKTKCPSWSESAETHPTCHGVDDPQCSDADLAAVKVGVWFDILYGSRITAYHSIAVTRIKKKASAAGIEVSDSCVACQAQSAVCRHQECSLSCFFSSWTSRPCLRCIQKKCALSKLCGVEPRNINVPWTSDGPANWIRDIEPNVTCAEPVPQECDSVQNQNQQEIGKLHGSSSMQLEPEVGIQGSVKAKDSLMDELNWRINELYPKERQSSGALKMNASGIQFTVSQRKFACGGSNVPAMFLEYAVPGARPVDAFNVLSNLAEAKKFNSMIVEPPTLLIQNRSLQASGWSILHSSIYGHSTELVRRSFVWQYARANTIESVFSIVQSSFNSQELQVQSALGERYIIEEICFLGTQIRPVPGGSHVIEILQANSHPPYHFDMTGYLELSWKIGGQREHVKAVRLASATQKAKGWNASHFVLPTWIVYDEGDPLTSKWPQDASVPGQSNSLMWVVLTGILIFALGMFLWQKVHEQDSQRCESSSTAAFLTSYQTPATNESLLQLSAVTSDHLPDLPILRTAEISSRRLMCETAHRP
eukprot:gnl/MRDRNA2_/MRDRNA2_81996_c0_seq1.p1 gnl/MRDRNA2_/MRDRNA2_81996_c0~~gnl/MRDRNA2_/MRDRNA2_81996_c0_seq1.p1  ORF type:complete len:850 (+),score=107.75 gnl/MRDRNA2_/MRDRNA2_81996_c0_seq1:181-2550(+)